MAGRALRRRAQLGARLLARRRRPRAHHAHLRRDPDPRAHPRVRRQDRRADELACPPRRAHGAAEGSDAARRSLPRPHRLPARHGGLHRAADTESRKEAALRDRVLARPAALGCGSVANHNDSSIATVSGPLAGDVPSGARVAIVWHAPKTGAWVVSNEAAVIGGAFSINLSGAPADDLFFDPNQSGFGGS